MLTDVGNPTGKHRPKRRHHGEGSVFERRDVYPAGHPKAGQRRYHAKPWVGVAPYRDELGRRREKWLSATSQREAEDLRRDFLRRIKAGTTVRAMHLTLADHLAAWLASQDGIAPSTYESYRNHINSRLASIGHLALADLTPTIIRAAMLGWSGSPATRTTALTVLRSAVRQAVEDRLIPVDPTIGVRAPTVHEYVPTILDAPDGRRLLEVARGDRLYALLVTTYGLALRRGEAFGIRASDIAPDWSYVRIAKSLRRIPEEFRADGEGPRRLVPPKADSGRAIPLPEFVADALRERIVERDREKRKPYAPNDFVFCDEHGNPIAFTTWARWFTRTVERAGLPPMRPHDLRHSTATLLLAEGVSERVVQEILGHKSGAMTRRYMKALPRMTRDAADRMNRAMTG